MTWKSAQAPEEVLLPSGNTALLVKPSVRALLTSGDIPAPIRAMISAEITGKAVKQRETSDLSPEDLAAYLRVQDTFVKAAFFQPRIVNEGETADMESTITLKDVSQEDIIFVFQWATQGGSAPAVTSFRDGKGVQGENVGPLSDGTDVPRATSSAAGD